MAKYPEWVYKHKRPGTAVKKIGERYYLVSSTSVRVEGHKNPKPVQKYIGIITEEGLVETGRRKVDTSGILVWEYGFTLAARKLFEESDITSHLACSDEYRKAAFQQAILHLSPQSIIRRDCTLPWNGDTADVLSVVEAMKRCPLPVTFDDLLKLRSIFLVQMGEKTFVSQIGGEERALLEKLDLEVAP